MDQWTTLHKYRRLASEQSLPTLNCPDCDKELVWTIGKKDEPVGWCVWEDTRYYPGLVFWQNVSKTILEYEE